MWYITLQKKILRIRSQDSPVGTVTVCELEGPELIPGRGKIFLFPTAVRPTLYPTHPRSQSLFRVIFLGVKRPGRETDTRIHLVQKSRMVELFLHSPLCLRNVVFDLIKHGQPYLYLQCLDKRAFIYWYKCYCISAIPVKEINLLLKYCDVFGRMPSLLGNLKLDTPVVARQPKVKHLHGYARHSSTVAYMLVA
jgi:hypothetical protein